MTRKLTLVPDRPAIGEDFSLYIMTLMNPLKSLAEVLDPTEGQSASVRCLLDVVNKDLEAKLRLLAEAVTAAYGEQELIEQCDEVTSIQRKEVAHG